jgi:hypothetical protein
MIWQDIKAGKSARALRRERSDVKTTKPFTTRMFINRVKSVSSHAEDVDPARVSASDRDGLRTQLQKTIAHLQTLLTKLDD